MTTQRKTDIEYTSDFFFVTFHPVSKAGKAAWTQMLEQAGTVKFDFYQLNDIKKQLKDAGYTVRKARKVKEEMSDKELLAALRL